MADRAFRDPYLKELMHKLESDYCEIFFIQNDKVKLFEREIEHLLRFSDILCRSENSEHRNLSLKIVSLLLELENVGKSKYFKMIAANTLVKLGNFPSLPIIDNDESYLRIDEIRNDYILKTLSQISPLGQPFTDAQYNVFEEMKKRNHFSFSGSTSFGKSFIFEAFTKHIIKEHNKTDNIAFIVPTKALINQVGKRLKEIVEEFGYKVITTPVIPKFFLNQENKYIFVFTAERLILYFTDIKNPKIDYLFVDEAHKLLSKKDTRTPLLYHSLVLAKRKSVNIYFASPNIPNSEVFLEMINNSTDESMSIIESPVAQNRFFIDTINDYSFMISDYGEDIILPKFQFRNNNVVGNLKLVMDTFSEKSQSLIYCNTVDKTIQTAIKYASLLPDINLDEINEVMTLIDQKVHRQYYLKKCLNKGVAYHFGSIPEEIKIRIEDLYKKGFIRFLFCTSTLLEGVNLPAKNIFILSEKIGDAKMTDIDFWNLAGRAGRLRKDISGNIFCVNLFNQSGYWKNSKDIEILRKKEIGEVKPQILSKKNENLYKNICNYLEQKDYSNKNISAEKKKTIEMYGNILIYHDSINSDSVLKDMFIDSNENAVSLLKRTRNSLVVSPEILATSIDISFINQNKIASREAPELPKTTNKEDCLEVLNILYDQYRWGETESNGRNPMIRHKNQLRYYATLMESWINTKPLKIVIQNTINYFYNNGDARDIYIRQDGRLRPVIFDKENDFHINKLINDVVNDIENILRFKIKNYISNYQALLKAKNKSNLDIADWESYIEYGTTENKIIEIQNLGFPRNIAIFLRNKYLEAFEENEMGVLCDVNEIYLKNKIDKVKNKFEYDEISILMNWENSR
ncbi:DEAD/DEAH box helicase [Lachnoanaerobaculum gingivalis]